MEKTDNEIIAEFMDHPMQRFDFNYTYDISWDALMPVVERIQSLGDHDGPERQKVLTSPISLSIKAHYDYCVEFIKWYNTQKQ